MRRLYLGLNSWSLAIGVLWLSLGCAVVAYGVEIDMDENASKLVTSADSSISSSKKTVGSRSVDHVFLTEEGTTRVIFEGKNLPSPSVEKLPQNRILIKLPKTKLGIASKIPGNNGVVRAIRSSIHSGGTAWIVIDVTNPVKWVLTKEKRGFSITLGADSALDKSSVAEVISPNDHPTSEKGEASGDKRLYTRLIDASLKPMDKGLKIVLTSDGPSKYTVRKLSRPEKLVIRFHGTKLEVQGKSASFKNLDNEIQHNGLLAMEMRQIGAVFSPITEALLTLAPGTTHQIDRDLNQLVITLSLAVSAEKPGERKGNINQLVSLDIEGADLSAVVKTLASESNFDVEILSGTLAGVVNQKFKDIPLKTALSLLLSNANQGYDYDVQGNTLRFGTRTQLIDSKRQMPHVTEIMSPPGGMSMDQFNSLVRTMTSPSSALETIPDTTRNVIILKGTPSDIADYKKAIKDLKLDEGSSGDLITKMVKLNYANAVQIIPILQPYLTPGGLASVREDVRTRQLVVREGAGNMGVILELIKELDIKLPQVLIESDIIEINDQKDLNLGIVWSATKLSGDPTVSTSFSEPGGGGGSFTFGTIKSGLNISATINALESRKKGKVISRPRIATTSGVPAAINTTETINIKSVTTVFQNGVNQVTETFTPLQLPISLQVIPRITDDGRITTGIVANITSQSGPAEGGAPPPTNTQTATTTITTKNGETIVIGGLVREIVQDTVSGIPILSSLPILGALFQGHEKVSRKVELVIFITPTLLED